MIEGQSPEEREAHFGPGGPVEAAKSWLEDILQRADVRSAWLKTDPDFRLALTQAIIFLNEQSPLLEDQDRDQLAQALAEDSPDHPLWESFAELLTQEFLNDLGEIRIAHRMEATPRPIAPGYELVLFPHAQIEAPATDPPEMRAHGVLVHFRQGVWLVAGLSERRAVPGWPPDLGY
jgi:hypothetical protein